jgi:hypothetical protein
VSTILCKCKPGAAQSQSKKRLGTSRKYAIHHIDIFPKCTIRHMARSLAFNQVSEVAGTVLVAREGEHDRSAKHINGDTALTDATEKPIIGIL